jgi:hypothetical protein
MIPFNIDHSKFNSALVCHGASTRILTLALAIALAIALALALALARNQQAHCSFSREALSRDSALAEGSRA